MGVVIGFLNVVILFPLFLSQEEFGLTRLVLSLATVMAQLSSFGVHRIAIKFFPVFRTERHRNNGLLRLLFSISLLGFLFFTILYFVFRDAILFYYQDDSALFANYYLWIPLAALGLLLFIVFESFLQSLRKTIFTNFLRSVFVRIYWLLALLAYYWGYCSFFQFMLIYMMGYFVTAALCVWQLTANNELRFDTNPQFRRKRIVKPMLNYGLYSLLSGITLILVTSIDLLMIGALMPPEEKLISVGVYAVATYIASVVYIPSNALTRIAAPIIAHDWKQKNLNKIEGFYKKSSIILLFFGGLIFGCIALNIDDILSFLKPEFRLGKYVILILGLTRLFDMATGVNSIILIVTRFYRAETVFAVLLVILVVITNLIFIPLYGINGAAFATASVFLFFNVAAFLFIWLKIGMQPFGSGTLKVVAFGMIAATITYLIPTDIGLPLFDIMGKSLLFGLFFTAPVYFYKVSPEIVEFIEKRLNVFRSR